MSFKNRIKHTINKVSIVQLVIIAYLLNLITSILFGYVFFPEEDANPNQLSASLFFFAGVLVAPLMETWLVQYSIMEYGYKWTQKYWPGFVLSIIIFSILHHYSIPYMLKTFITGFVYTSVYFICMIRKWNGFLWTSAVHFLHNLTALFFNYFIDG